MKIGNCCTAISREIKGPMFDLTVENDKTRCIDIEQTLSPRPRVPYIGAKVFIMAWIIAILASSIANKDHPDFWMAYLTHWGFLFTVAYSIMSVISAVVFAVRAADNTSGVLEGGVGLMAKTTWALFAIALPAEIMITILYWVLEFDGEVEYVSFMVHGGGMVLVAIDGFLLNRIPLRIKQFLLFETFTILYLIWNVVHAYSGIGNPYNGESQDDDAIYGSLAWKNKTKAAAMLSAGIAFVANPVLFLLCWAFARILPKRLCDKDEESCESSLGSSEV